MTSVALRRYGDHRGTRMNSSSNNSGRRRGDAAVGRVTLRTHRYQNNLKYRCRPSLDDGHAAHVRQMRSPFHDPDVS